MNGFDSPEFLFLAQKTQRSYTLSSMFTIFGGVIAICSAVTTDLPEDSVAFYVLLTLSCVCCAVMLVCLVLQIINQKYTKQMNIFLAQWTADTVRKSGILEGGGNIALHFTVEDNCTAIFLREGSPVKCVFDFAPAARYTAALMAMRGMALMYVKAYYYRQSLEGKLPDNVIIIDKTGKKPKTIYIITNGLPAKNKGAKNYFVKNGIL